MVPPKWNEMQNVLFWMRPMALSAWGSQWEFCSLKMADKLRKKQQSVLLGHHEPLEQLQYLLTDILWMSTGGREHYSPQPQLMTMSSYVLIFRGLTTKNAKLSIMLKVTGAGIRFAVCLATKISKQGRGQRLSNLCPMNKRLVSPCDC